MFSTLREKDDCCALTTGFWPFRYRLQFHRDTGVLRILRPFRKTTTLQAANIHGVEYARLGAWYTEVYFAFWYLLIRSRGKTQRLLSTALHSRSIEKFTQTLHCEIDTLRDISNRDLSTSQERQTEV